MNRAEKELERKLDGYAEFLRKRQLVLPKHQPHLVRWVREFLVFATEHRGYTFEQTQGVFAGHPGCGNDRNGIRAGYFPEAFLVESGREARFS